VSFAGNFGGIRAGEAGVGEKWDEIEGNQPGGDERQGGEGCLCGFCAVALEQEHSFDTVGAKIELAQGAGLVEFPGAAGFGFQQGWGVGCRVGGGQRAFDRQNFHRFPFC
jgi:hypothetical protein